MIDYLTSEGVPLGPFAQPRTVFVRPSGRGKLHLHSACVDKLVSREAVLAELAEDEVCRRCADSRTFEERDWEELAENYLSVLDAVEPVVEPDWDADYFVYAPTAQTSWWAGYRPWQLRLQHPYESDLDGGRHELHAWAVETVLPVLDAALAKVAAATPHLQCDDMAARWAAALGVDSVDLRYTEPFRSRRYPALGIGHGSAHGPQRLSLDEGQGTIVRDLRQALIAAIRNGHDRAECRQAAVDAGLASLAEETSYAATFQIPLDSPIPAGDHGSVGTLLIAAWREQAGREVEDLARLLTDMAFVEIAEHQAAPLVALDYNVTATYHAADEVMLRNVIGPLGASYAESQDMLVQVPATLVRFLRNHARGQFHSFGEVQPDDTLATYVDALGLLDGVAENHETAIDLARATAIPLPA